MTNDSVSAEDSRLMAKEARGEAWGRVFWAAAFGAFLGTLLALEVHGWL